MQIMKKKTVEVKSAGKMGFKLDLLREHVTNYATTFIVNKDIIRNTCISVNGQVQKEK